MRRLPGVAHSLARTFLATAGFGITITAMKIMIVDDSEVPFARPRTIETSFAPEFVLLTQRLRERIVAARTVQEAAS